MMKSLKFLLVLLSSHFCSHAQNPFNCASKLVQDSLMDAFSNRAHKLGVFHRDYVTTLDSLTTICPNIAEAYQEKAFPYLFKGDYQKAFELEDKAVELDPKRWTAYRGYLYCIYVKNYQKAVADFVEAEKITPGAHVMDHTYAFYFGLCYLQTGAFELAEKSFLQDIAQQQKRGAGNDVHFNSLFYLGVVYYEMKELELSEKYLKDCLQLYDQFPEANFYLGKVLQVTGNVRAASYFSKAHESYLEGYRINEPNWAQVNYPRIVSLEELKKMRQN